jgi:hypothetical protein
VECEQKSENLAFRELYWPLGDRMLNKRLDLLVLLNEEKAVRSAPSSPTSSSTPYRH